MVGFGLVILRFEFLCFRFKGNFNLIKLLVFMKKNLFFVSVIVLFFVGMVN